MMDYKLKLVEFIALWHEYNQQQELLAKARNQGKVDAATNIMYRVIEIKKDINDQLAPVLNTIKAEEAAEKAKHLTVIKGGIEG